jgi:hypothetical protein
VRDFPHFLRDFPQVTCALSAHQRTLPGYPETGLNSLSLRRSSLTGRPRLWFATGLENPLHSMARFVKVCQSKSLMVLAPRTPPLGTIAKNLSIIPGA